MKKRGVPPAFRGLAGAWLYRSSGPDGDLTLAADTTLAAGTNVLNLGTLNLAGFTLRPNPATPYLTIVAQRIVGPGTISVRGCGVTNGTGAARQTNGGAGSYGGAGGDCATRLRVIAEVWEGAITLDAKGGNGESGQSPSGGATPAGPAAGNVPTGTTLVQLLTISTGAIVGANYAGGAPGSGASLPLLLSSVAAAQRTYFNRLMRDPLRFLMAGGSGATLSADGNDPMAFYSIPGFGGSSGSYAAGPASVPGGATSSGGGGSGGPNPFAEPGTPNTGRFGSENIDAATTAYSGGGGGAGGAAGMIEAYGDRVLGHVTIDVRGGDGGAGGNALVSGFNAANQTRAPGGSGGSGGAGGAALACLPRGKYTISRGGGSGGAAGAGANQAGADAAWNGTAATAGGTGYIIGERR